MSENYNERRFRPDEQVFYTELIGGLIRKMAFELGDWYGIDKDLIKEHMPSLEIIRGYKSGIVGDSIATYNWDENKMFLSDSAILTKNDEEPEGKPKDKSLITILGEEIGHFLHILQAREYGYRPVVLSDIKSEILTGIQADNIIGVPEQEFFGRLGANYVRKKLGIEHGTGDEDFFLDTVMVYAAFERDHKKFLEEEDTTPEKIQDLLERKVKLEKFMGYGAGYFFADRHFERIENMTKDERRSLMKSDIFEDFLRNYDSNLLETIEQSVEEFQEENVGL